MSDAARLAIFAQYQTQRERLTYFVLAAAGASLALLLETTQPPRLNGDAILFGLTAGSWGISFVSGILSALMMEKVLSHNLIMANSVGDEIRKNDPGLEKFNKQIVDEILRSEERAEFWRQSQLVTLGFGGIFYLWLRSFQWYALG